MSVVAAAVLPHPPLVVPGLAPGPSSQLDELRAASDTALAWLLSRPGDALIVVGGGPGTICFPPHCRGSFSRWGVDLEVSFGSPPADRVDHPPLPLSLLVAAQLLKAAGQPQVTALYSIALTAPASECAELGRRLAESADRVRLLVMGDGSARRGEGSPGTPDPRAAAFDAAVAAALASGDSPALGELSPELAESLVAQGRAAWQVLAGAVGGQRIRAERYYTGAPFGVGYFVATWATRTAVAAPDRVVRRHTPDGEGSQR